MKTLWNLMFNEIKLALHNKLIFLCLLFSIMLIPIMNLFNFFNVEQEMKIIKDFTFSIVSIIGILLSVFYPIYSLKEDLERKFIYNVLSKPISRASYIIGKYLGSCIIISFVCVINFFILYIIILLKNFSISPSYIGASLLLLFKFYLIIMVSITMGLLPFSFHLSSILSVFFFIVGTLKGYIMTAMKFSESLIMTEILYPFLKIFPNFQIFDVYESVIGGSTLTANNFIEIIGYAACYITALLFLSWLIMRGKEI
ncbi:MAG: ABC transporter permease [Candidatus Aureabacteria bacterium]|nr:ABC transporter permease [Candidatus Auribacterota bacterium]